MQIVVTLEAWTTLCLFVGLFGAATVILLILVLWLTSKLEARP